MVYVEVLGMYMIIEGLELAGYAGGVHSQSLLSQEGFESEWHLHNPKDLRFQTPQHCIPPQNMYFNY